LGKVHIHGLGLQLAAIVLDDLAAKDAVILLGCSMSIADRAANRIEHLRSRLLAKDLPAGRMQRLSCGHDRVADQGSRE
jgi:hypothetical protein